VKGEIDGPTFVVRTVPLANDRGGCFNSNGLLGLAFTRNKEVAIILIRRLTKPKDAAAAKVLARAEQDMLYSQ
jgi:hypothetical protein